MSEPTFSWPATAPRHGDIVLREFRAADTDAVIALSTDPYIPLVTTLTARATPEQAADWIDLQRSRLDEGVGFSFAIAEARTGQALGQIGLWLRDIGDGRASAGYTVLKAARGRGVAADALRALTGFAWTIPAIHRVELYIEPWNTASIRTAEHAGYQREGLLRSHQRIGDTRRDMLIHAIVRSP